MIRGSVCGGAGVGPDVALRFYTEALGFKVITDQPFTVSRGGSR